MGCEDYFTRFIFHLHNLPTFSIMGTSGTALGSPVKEKLWLDGFEHSVVRDGKRQVVFDAIGEFLKKIEVKR